MHVQNTKNAMYKYKDCYAGFSCIGLLWVFVLLRRANHLCPADESLSAHIREISRQILGMAAWTEPHVRLQECMCNLKGEGKMSLCVCISISHF